MKVTHATIILPSPLCSRKDIAIAINVSARMVKTNERYWGLDMVRADLNCRQIRYNSDKAAKILEHIVQGIRRRSPSRS